MANDVKENKTPIVMLSDKVKEEVLTPFSSMRALTS